MAVLLHNEYYPLTLAECYTLSPVDMAQRSALVRQNYDYLIRKACGIRDEALRRSVLGVLQNPAPTFLSRYDDYRKEEVLAAFQQKGLLAATVTADQLFPACPDPRKAPQPFWSAPGSDYPRHHCYPGGLALHTAFNVKATLYLCRTYQEVYGHELDADTAVAAQILHDSSKAWILQWQEDGSSLPQLTLAAAGLHHIAGLAESVYRGLPPDVILTQACTHNYPGAKANEQEIAGWLKLACRLAGQDPVAAGLLAPCGQMLRLPHKQELFVAHLGDHGWILGMPAVQKVIDAMHDLALQDYGMTVNDLGARKFNAFRNYLFSQAGCLNLHQILTVHGRHALKETVRTLILA